MDQRSAVTFGLDVGDRHSQVCVLDAISGEVIEESRIRTTAAGIRNYFANRQPGLVTLEVGTHSPWITRELSEANHEVIVANARKVRLIHGVSRKNDRLDAEKLARLARIDAKLLSPIVHRSSKAQADLARLRSRDALVRTRSALIAHVRGSVKAYGSRLPTGASETFASKARERLPIELRPALEPVLTSIETLTTSIETINAELAALADEYPATKALRQVNGVGLLTALTFQLVIEDPSKFSSSREVGPYLGLAPGERQSGEREQKRTITKEGDTLLRRLLVQCTHLILNGKSDSDLKRAGQRITAKGRHRSVAVTAVARKLAVLLHSLWMSGEVYEPLRNHKNTETTEPPTSTRATP